MKQKFTEFRESERSLKNEVGLFKDSLCYLPGTEVENI